MTTRRKTILKLAKGFRGRSKNCFRIARPRVQKSLLHAYRHRKLRRRNARKLWIQRVGAGVREYGMKYSFVVNALQKSNIKLDRKILSTLAMTEPYSFRCVLSAIGPYYPKIQLIKENEKEKK